MTRDLAVAVALGGAVLLQQPTWTPQISGSQARLRGVSAVSDKVAWASGTGGTVLRTTDAGVTWTTHVVPGAEKLDFRDIDAFSERVAYTLSIGNGEDSRIYKTSDGGENWSLQLANSDPKIFLDAMAFWTHERGIAYSDSIDGQFVVFETGDGRTWQRIPSSRLPPALPNEGAYAASGTNVAVHGDHVWIATTAARVLHSADRGRTWSVAQTPIATGESAGIFSVAFRDARRGVAVGGDYRKEDQPGDNGAFTDDGGRTWTLARGLSGYRSAVSRVPNAERRWLAVGPRGADISDDDGRTWKPLNAPGFHALTFAPRRAAGWAVGERGSIARIEIR